MKTSFLSLFVACAAWAQVTPLEVGWSFQTLPTTQPMDPAFLPLIEPDGGPYVVTTSAQLSPQIIDVTDAGIRGQPLSFGTYAVDVKGDVLAFASGTYGIAFVQKGADGGFGQVGSWLTTGQSTQLQIALGAKPAGLDLWATTGTTTVNHWTLTRNTSNLELDAGVEPALTAPGVPWALAVDDQSHRVFAAIQYVGVATVEADGGSTWVLSLDGGQLGVSVDGIDVYPADDGSTVVFTSSSSLSSVFIHQLKGTTDTFLGAIKVLEPDGGSGAVQAPKFLDVNTTPVPGFPRGALVLQDESSFNVKVVSLDTVNARIPLPAAFGSADAGLSDAGIASDGGIDGGKSSTGGSSNLPPVKDPQNPSDPDHSTPSSTCNVTPVFPFSVMLLVWWRRRRS